MSERERAFCRKVLSVGRPSVVSVLAEEDRKGEEEGRVYAQLLQEEQVL